MGGEGRATGVPIALVGGAVSGGEGGAGDGAGADDGAGEDTGAGEDAAKAGRADNAIGDGCKFCDATPPWGFGDHVPTGISRSLDGGEGGGGSRRLIGVVVFPTLTHGSWRRRGEARRGEVRRVEAR